MKFSSKGRTKEWGMREVFAHFLIGKGPLFSPKSGLGKSLTEEDDEADVIILIIIMVMIITNNSNNNNSSTITNSTYSGEKLFTCILL